MIICNDFEQGTPEWFAARLGIPTASSFDKLITPTGKPSSQAKGYMCELLAEWLLNRDVKSFAGNEWTERGQALEPEARAQYEFITDRQINTVGIVYMDDRKLVSASPDGLAFDAGTESYMHGLEIKSPSPAVHVEYLLSDTMPDKYKAQVQGSMLVTDLDRWDFVSYHPDMDPAIITVRRDEKFIKTLSDILDQFVDEMLEKREKLINGSVAA